MTRPPPPWTLFLMRGFGVGNVQQRSWLQTVIVFLFILESVFVYHGSNDIFLSTGIFVATGVVDYTFGQRGGRSPPRAVCNRRNATLIHCRIPKQAAPTSRRAVLRRAASTWNRAARGATPKMVQGAALKPRMGTLACILHSAIRSGIPWGTRERQAVMPSVNFSPQRPMA